MKKFQVGDRVRISGSSKYGFYLDGQKGTVTAINVNYDGYISVTPDDARDCGDHNRQLLPEQLVKLVKKAKFAKGDKILFTGQDYNGSHNENAWYTVLFVKSGKIHAVFAGDEPGAKPCILPLKGAIKIKEWPTS